MGPDPAKSHFDWKGRQDASLTAWRRMRQLRFRPETGLARPSILELLLKILLFHFFCHFTTR